MSYPIKDSPSERTGDRLSIRCLEFSPPDDSGLSMNFQNMFKWDSEGKNFSAITGDDRKRIGR